MRGSRMRPARAASLFLVLPPLLLVLVALRLFLLLLLLLIAPAFLLLAALVLGILLALLGHGGLRAAGGVPGWGHAVHGQVKRAWESTQKFVKAGAAPRVHAGTCLQYRAFAPKPSAYADG